MLATLGLTASRGGVICAQRPRNPVILALLAMSSLTLGGRHRTTVVSALPISASLVLLRRIEHDRLDDMRIRVTVDGTLILLQCGDEFYSKSGSAALAIEFDMLIRSPPGAVVHASQSAETHSRGHFSVVH